jgi:hypothetical protein
MLMLILIAFPEWSCAKLLTLMLTISPECRSNGHYRSTQGKLDEDGYDRWCSASASRWSPTPWPSARPPAPMPPPYRPVPHSGCRRWARGPGKTATCYGCRTVAGNAHACILGPFALAIPSPSSGWAARASSPLTILDAPYANVSLCTWCFEIPAGTGSGLTGIITHPHIPVIGDGALRSRLVL